MNQRWNDFEKSLGERVKRYDARREMGFWQRIAHFFDSRYDRRFLANSNCILMLARGGLSLIGIVIAVSRSEELIPYPDSVMMAIAIWSLFLAMCRPEMIRDRGGYMEYCSLWMLPLTPDRILRHLAKSLSVGFACLFFEFLCAYGIVMFACRQPFSSFPVCVLCSISQVLFALAVTLLIITRRIMIRWLLVSMFFIFLAAAGMSHEPITSSLKAKLFNLANPMGWINVLYLEGWVRGNSRAWWLLIPVVGVLATLPSSLRAFRRLHHNGEFRKERARGGNILCGPALPAPVAPLPMMDAGELRRQLLSSDFLNALQWKERGWLETLLHRVLRPDEIAIAKALLISPPRWKRNLLLFVVCLLANWLLQISPIGLDGLHSLVHRAEWGPVAAGAALLLTCGLSIVTVRYAWRLLSWPTHPWVPVGLLPLRGFNAWKVSAKINGLMFALIFPLVLLSPASPFGFHLQHFGRQSLGFLARVIMIVASCSFVGAWTVAVYLGRLNRRLSLATAVLPMYGQLVVVMILFTRALRGLQGSPWLGSSSTMADFVAAPALIAACVGWSYLCAYLELKAWPRPGLKVRKETAD